MSAQKKVALYTLGCKLNYSETSAIGRKFEEKGFEKVDFENRADVYVINTCSVTEQADQKCRNIIRKAKRQSPNSKVVVIGCYAQLQPETISDIEGVDLVLGTQEKFNILDYLSDLEGTEHGCQIHSTDIDKVDFYEGAYSIGDRTRTFLKVQDGCDYGCAFCTIPMARGRSRSRDINAVKTMAEEIAQKGVKEIVLTGVNTGDFGKGPSGARRPNEAFIDLIKVLDEIEGIERFRISSIEPNLLTNEIIEFVAQSKRFMPHFHIPLQSGSNKVLTAMRRRYQRELYAERVAIIKKLMPHCSIGVDVIVGFPGETERDFLEAYQFINRLDVSYLHVFTYSERPNTFAADLLDVVPMEERRKRSKMLRGLSDKKQRHYYDSYIGHSRPVLFEANNADGFMSGFTDNYIKVKLPYKQEMTNNILPVTLRQVDAIGDMRGEKLHHVFEM